MPITLKQIACVNCNMLTRADQLLCLNNAHGIHRRDVKGSLRCEPGAKPTTEDREAYFLWLSRNGVREGAD